MRVQRLDAPGLEEANRLARDEVANGAGALALVLAGTPTAHGRGVVLEAIDDLAAVLGGIDLAGVCLRIEAGGRWREAAALAAALVKTGAVDPGRRGYPFRLRSARCRGGGGDARRPPGARPVAAALGARGFRRPVALADGRPWHVAGASDGQELAIILAAAVEYLRALEAADHDPAAAAAAIGFALAVDQDQLGAIAKQRARRLAWATVRAECGLPEAPAHIGERADRNPPASQPACQLLE